MTVIAVAMVKDEADVIAATVGHMLTQVDGVIVADNGSTDGTREILEKLGVELVDDPEIGYWQSRKMTALAQRALERGAEWVVPFDADEVWIGRTGLIRDVLADHQPDYGLVTASLFDHVATGIDPSAEAFPDPVRRMAWRRRYPLPLPKVACRACPSLVIEQGNHWARCDIPPRFTDVPPLAVRHYPYRSVEQMVRKVRNGYAAYAATEGLPPEVGEHWRKWGAWSDEQIADCFRRWYWRADPRLPVVIEGERQEALLHDPAPVACP